MIRLHTSGVAFCLLVLLGISKATEPNLLQPKRVLILHSHSRALPITLEWERGITAGLEASIREPVAIDVEYLAFERLMSRADRDAWLDLLRRKYADSPPDVVVPVSNAAAECIAQSYPELFPQAAVVFCSVNELCAELSALKGGTIVLFLTHERDRDGRVTLSPRDVAKRISESCNVPVFGLYDTLMGSGIMGGHLGMAELQGERAGTLVARVIQGESPADIPFSGTEMNRVIFDWRQLRRWGISEKSLPEGSIVQFREPTVWDKYWLYITATVTAIMLQSLLILVLLVNRWKRRRAEEAGLGSSIAIRDDAVRRRVAFRCNQN